MTIPRENVNWALWGSEITLASPDLVITHRSPCSSCVFKHVCLPSGISLSEIEALDDMTIGHRRVHAGDSLYRQGDRFQFLYAVLRGTFKSSVVLLDGREQVSGFHMTGELLGLDGVGNGVHASAAVALEDADACTIAYITMGETLTASAVVQKAVTRLMSREIVREHSLRMLIGSANVEERVAAFLLYISRRMEVRGYSATDFHLRMSRAEIGSYLGMKIETVSRTLSGFQKLGLLEVDKRHIRIIDCKAFEDTFGSRIIQ